MRLGGREEEGDAVGVWEWMGVGERGVGRE